jgi:uncharacterized protein YdeI (YjbR/CyaY-like superfamily)
MSPEDESVAFPDAAAFEAWLADHPGHREGVWLRIAKQGSGLTTLTSDEAVDSGLCFGWVSGQRRALDERCFLQKYVPRRPRSRWSLVNVRKVEALTAAGRMRPEGQGEVDAAKADGRWDAAYESQAEATTPPDLQHALDADPAATATWEAMNRTQRYAVILDLLTTRDPARRATKVRAAVDRLRG